MLDLKYLKLSRLCLGLLIIFSILSIAFEQLHEEKNKDGQYTNAIRYFIVAREISELIETITYYSLLVLQFFMTKKERKNK